MTGRTVGDAAAGALFDEVVRCGVRHVCLSPGSRSTPLAVAALSDDRLRVHVSIDERSSAFLALGIARATGVPAVALSTSGTAAANFLPAVTEASNAGVPMLVVTADRPPELRGTGANQTIDQLKIYGGFVRWFCETGVPEDRPGAGAYWRSLACRAWAEATRRDAGPVHLNVSFREPLVAAPEDDVVSDFSGRAGGAPWTETSPGAAAPDPRDVEWLAEKAASAARGLVLAGAGDTGGRGVHALAEAAGWPILAEPASGLRSGPFAISAYEALLRSGWGDEHRPDFVLRLGKIGISRVVNAFFGHDVEQALVDPAGRWLDPERTAHRIVAADPDLLCAAAAERVPPRATDGWLEEWIAAETAARTALDAVLDARAEVSEPRVARDVARRATDGATLVVAASMPVRDLDWFMSPRTGLRIVANRGANGIDGFVSTALGVALASSGRTFALAGDLSMLHDVNGLLLARSEDVAATFVVLNNDGGGIFSFLPQAGAVPEFERAFSTPHGVSFADVARAYGCGHRLLETADDLPGALDDAAAAGGVQLIEPRTDRDANVELHRELWAAVGAALGR
ncbi:MAG TPA: 2-succinyl-5-enolpyruvyl-6-hydroxy-3-cyclohexene-1-carboxylic-acid synthase [Actinomycetota bacterium]|nr:2-succinyl-5-enolpyruvyl-6-hydroxy-3-cyclohexene-1-carboxylic-acid synthase [Actinomycetota bacterium]